MRFLSTLLASTLGVFLAMSILFFFGLLFLVGLASLSDQAPRVRPGSVLVMPLSGPVPEVVADDPLAEALGGRPAYDLLDVRQALAKAAVDDRIGGVWLQLQGVQGSWATLQEIREALVDYKASGKPLIASAEDNGVSEGSYYLASAADEVYAAAMAPFEFNGFYIAAEFYVNLLEKLEVEPQVVRAGTYKSAVEPFIREDLSPENEEQLTALLASQNDVFLKAVAESRDLPVEELERIIEEELIFTASDAYEAGLLDGLLYRDEVVTRFEEQLEYEEDEELRTVNLSAYAHVPLSDVDLEVVKDGEIAIVYAVGTILSGESGYNVNPLLGGEIVGAETFAKAMRTARESERIKAVVVRVDSPGGSAPAADAMWREIALTREEKPVVISMGGVAASGGYWIATAGDVIMADPLTITGSIGVFSLFFDASGLFEEKLGVTFDVVETGPHADMFSGLRPLTPEETRLFGEATDQTYRLFLEHVATSRKMSVEAADALAQGRVWTGVQAHERGLVDELGTLRDAVLLAASRAGLPEGYYPTRILPAPQTLFERLNEAMQTRLAGAWLRLTGSPVEEALLHRYHLLRTLNELHGTVQARMPVDLTIH